MGRVLRSNGVASRSNGFIVSVSSVLLFAAACGQSQDGSTMPGSGGAAGNAGTSAPSNGAAGQASSGASSSSSGAWCDVLAILSSNCQQCHGAQRKYGAPMSMVTYADLQAPAVTDAKKKVYELVGVRIHDKKKPMPPTGSTALTSAQLATLDSWIAGGAKSAADPTCAAATTGGAGTGGPSPGTAGMAGAGSGPGPVAGGAGSGGSTTTAADWPADCEEHYKFIANDKMGGPYKVPAGGEQHPQFMFTPPWTGPVQGLRFKPITDNPKVIHHWILYAGDGAFLSGWAPGNNGLAELPPDVGIYLPSGAGASLRLDVHYNNVGGTAAEPDASGVEVCVISTQSKFRPNTATTYGFTAAANAPAHMTITNTNTCTVTASQGPVHLIGQSPHMHKLGVHAKFEFAPSAGPAVVIHDQPFDFFDQRLYPLSDVVTKTGDKFTTSCTYTNPTDTNVSFGQNTENEMCFNFVLYYPKGGLACR